LDRRRASAEVGRDRIVWGADLSFSVHLPSDWTHDATFWDGEKPIRFRMHRFEAHMIQHTVQVDKTLEWLDLGPTEARRLARVLYRDLAAVEMLSANSFGQNERDEVAKTISDYASDIGARGRGP